MSNGLRVFSFLLHLILQFRKNIGKAMLRAYCFPFRRSLSAGTASAASLAPLVAGSSARAVPAGKIRTKQFGANLCDEASVAIQEHMFSTRLHSKQHGITKNRQAD